MARPQVLHDGFLIPNAADVTNPRMAEPDRVDFNTVAHALWGVVEGCEVTVAGTTASTSGGTLLVNGQLVTLQPGTTNLGVSSAQDRFVLVASDAGGILTTIPGTAAVDPVFPDVPLDRTVLAAVFCPTSATNLADNVIDKRKFIPKSLLTKISPTADLVRNLNGTGSHYLIGGDGKTTWESDTWMWRSAASELSIYRHLKLEGALTAQGGGVFGSDVNIDGNVSAKNLRWNGVMPAAPVDPASIWQDKNTGRIFVWRNGLWEELATIRSANPPGTVITSWEKPSVMMSLGWIPIDGRKVYEADAPGLFNVQGIQHLIVNDTPRYIQLPNAQRLGLVTDWERNPGVKVSTHPNNLITLQTANMPRHAHNPRALPAGSFAPNIRVNRAGDHGHNVYGGAHEHDVVDPGHNHNGMDFMGIGSSVVALVWGGRNKIDAFFNDRNHTYSVEALDWTQASLSNIRVSTDRSEHWHVVDPNGGHDHIATMDAVPDHVHVLQQDLVGGDIPIDVTPEYLTTYAYIRS
jgi:hypothetical protein